MTPPAQHYLLTQCDQRIMLAAMCSSTPAIASSVRAELARKDLSGRQLAANLGWSTDAVQRRLSGTVPFTAAELATVAEHLGVSITKFYEPCESRS